MSHDRKLRELSEKATPGRWEADHHFSCHSRIVSGKQFIAETECKHEREAIHEADATFIVACVNHVREQLVARPDAESVISVCTHGPFVDEADEQQHKFHCERPLTQSLSEEPFTEPEQQVIVDLAKRLDISEHKVLVQGLRTYQLIVMGTHRLEEVRQN